MSDSDSWSMLYPSIKVITTIYHPPGILSKPRSFGAELIEAQYSCTSFEY
jgi:hypothetical protein